VFRASQLWVQPLDGSTRRIVDTTSYSRRSPAVSPDGQWIAYVGDPGMRHDSLVQAIGDSISRLAYDAKRDEAPRNDADVFVVSVNGGAPRRLTSANGSEGDIAWSPDGRFITYVSSPTRTSSRRLYQVPATGGAPVNLLGDWQYEPQDYWWTASGQLMLASAIGGRTALFRLDPTTRQLTEVIGGRRRLNGFTTDAKHTKVAYVSTSITKPTELYLANADGTGETKLTSFNDKLNAEIEWPDAERFTYKSVGGLEIEAWLQKPAGYRPGQKYPLVLGRRPNRGRRGDRPGRLPRCAACARRSPAASGRTARRHRPSPARARAGRRTAAGKSGGVSRVKSRYAPR
jgi:dipeptidyl aminopeptidase/acylaminoacyl peptidase